MKTISTKVILLVAFLLNITSRAEMVDILKPEIHAKELAVKKLMQSLLKTGVAYTFKVEVSGGWGPFSSKRFGAYFVTLSEGIQKQIDALDFQVFHEALPTYLEDKAQSFNAAVLMMAEEKDFQVLGEYFHPKQAAAFEKADKTQWDFSAQGSNFCESYDWNLKRRPVGKFSGVENTASYKYPVLYASIPSVYIDILNSEPQCMDILNRGESDSVLQAYMRDKRWTYRSLLTGNHFGVIKLAMFNFTSDVRCIFPTARWKERRINDTREFLAFCRENDPMSKPCLPALMMGVFTVDGYDFNDESGVYTMNERGKMLMDFIAEFPIPENATRVQAVMGGGNKDEIEGMMRKHGTEAKW